MSTQPFTAWYHPAMSDSKSTPAETFIYVGCVHETTETVVQKLAALAQHPPHYLIFCGDVTGSHEMEEFKRRFYNYVNNCARKELELHLPNSLPDYEILNFVSKDAPQPGYTLSDGYKYLVSYQYELEGMAENQAIIKANALTPAECLKGIKEVADQEFYGPWVKKLSRSVRQGVAKTMGDDAEKLWRAIAPLQASGVKIHIVGGNWDDRQNTVDNMTGDDIEVFDTVPFFRAHGLTFHDKINFLETETSFQVFVPYWELLRYSEESNDRFEYAASRAKAAQSQGKTIIMVAHAEPNWSVHQQTAANPNKAPGGIRQKLIEKLDELLLKIAPDEIVYPHQHNLLTASTGKKLDPNTKYVLEMTAQGVKLIDDPAHMGKQQQTIASYVPLQHFGTLSIPLSGNPRPKLFGGDRDPVYVS